MKREEAFEIENILADLSRYEYPFIKQKIKRIQEIVQPMIDAEQDRIFKEKRAIKWSWSKFDPRKECMRINNAMQILNHFEEAKAELHQYERITQDILHAFELAELSDDEKDILIEELTRVRQYRRIAKDFVLVSEPFYNLVSQHHKTLKQFGQAQTEIDKQIRYLENRSYTPREITALAEAFNRAKEKQEV